MWRGGGENQQQNGVTIHLLEAFCLHIDSSMLRVEHPLSLGVAQGLTQQSASHPKEEAPSPSSPQTPLHAFVTQLSVHKGTDSAGVYHTQPLSLSMQMQNQMTVISTKLLALNLSFVMDSPDILQMIAKDRDCLDVSILDCRGAPHMSLCN